MAGQFFRVKHIFSYGGYGWQETWWNNTAGSAAAALALGLKLVPTRTALLNVNTVLEEVQASEEPDPTAGNLANPGNPFKTRGDSQVSVPTRNSQLGAPPNTVTTFADCDPWQSMQFTLIGTPGGGDVGPYYHRSCHLRGLSTNYYNLGVGGVLSWVAPVQTALLEFLKAVAVNGFCVRAVDKAPAFLPIISCVAGVLPNTAVLGYAAGPPPFSPGQYVTVKGWPKKSPGLNGAHRVVAVGANSVTIAFPPPVAPAVAPIPPDVPLPPQPELALRVLGYFPIVAPINFPVTRLRKRDTGRNLWTSAGRKRARAIPNP